MIDKIRAEIERRMDFYYKRYTKKGFGSIEEYRYDECVDLLSFLDTLEEKSEKPNQDELEKEIDCYCREKCHTILLNENLRSKDKTRAIARHFAQWGAEHSGHSEIPNNHEEHFRDATKMIDGLNEAAEKYSNANHIVWSETSDDKIEIAEAFKAGAGWAFGQGVSADGIVAILTNRAWVTPDDSLEQKVLDNFRAGENVIVQIRKR